MARNFETGWIDQQRDRDASQRTRDELVEQIKVALVTTAGLGIEERPRGFDPYNSKLGQTPRDVWSRRRRT